MDGAEDGPGRHITVKPRFTGVVGGKEITPVNRGSR